MQRFYFLDSKHNEVKEALLEKNFKDFIIAASNNKKYDLPNTTLNKENTSTDEAIKILQNICKVLDVKLTKAIAVLYGDYTVVN